jgi:methylmalonyl-CoA mutase
MECALPADGMHLPLTPAAAPGAADWERAAGAVLTKLGRARPGVAVPDLLARTTIDGVTVPALSTGVTVVSDPGRAPFVRGTAARLQAAQWDVRTRVVDPDPRRAAASAIDDLANGGTSLWVTLGGNGTRLDDLPLVLDEVYLDLAPVIVQATGDVPTVEAAWALAELLLRTDGVHPATNLGADPLGRAIRAGTAPTVGELPEVVELALRSGVRAAVVDATVAHEAGAAEVGELGYAVATGVAYLREIAGAGVPIDRALSMIEFRYSATSDQFLTIAKLRAARLLWHRVAQLSGASPTAGGQVQHAVTSWPMMTRYDPWTNLLRSTLAAFAAGVGGADAVTVHPFDAALGVPEAFGRRLARNTSTLLLAESHVGAALDPAGGAPAVEALTAELAAAGWAEFQQIEAHGGTAAAVADLSLPHRWARTAGERRSRTALRLQPITGVSEFPDADEQLLPRSPYALAEPPGWAAEFEAMRDSPVPGRLLVAILGSPASANARAAFAINVFAAGGVSTTTTGPGGSVDELTARYDGSAVVCLAAADATYLADGPAAVWALRTAGASWVILAGAPGAEMEQLVDDSIAVGDDVVAFLQRTREQLSKAADR